MSIIWNLPTVNFKPLSQIVEKRPAALITNASVWNQLSSQFDLPVVVQAEPQHANLDELNALADHLPKKTEVVYAVGTGLPVTAGKIVAQRNKLPLIIVPEALESDAIFEAHVFLPKDGKLNRMDTGSADEIYIDWDVIQAARENERGAAIVDILAIVTALLDWRYAARMNKNTPDQKFSAWGASVAASLASQAIKSAESIGRGDIEGLRTLLDLLMVSVRLAHQLGHDRHQEGTEHYLAFSMWNQGSQVSHGNAVGAGILFASALHGQDPNSLRDALTKAGVDVDAIPTRDLRRGLGDLPDFCEANELAFGRSHDLDPFSGLIAEVLDKADILNDDDDSQSMMSDNPGNLPDIDTAVIEADDVQEPASPTAETEVAIEVDREDKNETPMIDDANQTSISEETKDFAMDSDFDDDLDDSFLDDLLDDIETEQQDINFASLTDDIFGDDLTGPVMMSPPQTSGFETPPIDDDDELNF